MPVCLLLLFIAPFWAVVEAIKTGFLGDDDDVAIAGTVVAGCRTISPSANTVIARHGALFTAPSSKCCEPLFADLVRPFFVGFYRWHYCCCSLFGLQ